MALALLSTVPVAWRSPRPLTACRDRAVRERRLHLRRGAAPGGVPAVRRARRSTAYSVGEPGRGTAGAVGAAGCCCRRRCRVFVAASAARPGLRQHDPVVRLAGRGLGGRADRPRAGAHKNAALEAANRELEEQRELQAQAAVAVERGRIARELHDVVAHNVSMMVVQAGAAARVLDGRPAATCGTRSTAIAATGRADGRRDADAARRAPARRRRARAPRPQPGLADLEQLVGEVREAGLPVELRVEGEPRAAAARVDLSAYRIVQEALTNTLKHAGAATRGGDRPLRPTARSSSRSRDDGDGRHGGRAAGTGHGLVGMRERVALFGGELDAGPAADGGLRASARGCRRHAGAGMIRVLLADDQALVRGGLPADPRRRARHRGRRRGRPTARRPSRRALETPARRGPDGHPDAGARRDRGDPAAASRSSPAPAC